MARTPPSIRIFSSPYINFTRRVNNFFAVFWVLLTFPGSFSNALPLHFWLFRAYTSSLSSYIAVADNYIIVKCPKCGIKKRFWLSSMHLIELLFYHCQKQMMKGAVEAGVYHGGTSCGSSISHPSNACEACGMMEKTQRVLFECAIPKDIWKSMGLWGRKKSYHGWPLTKEIMHNIMLQFGDLELSAIFITAWSL